MIIIIRERERDDDDDDDDDDDLLKCVILFEYLHQVRNKIN